MVPTAQLALTLLFHKHLLKSTKEIGQGYPASVCLVHRAERTNNDDSTTTRHLRTTLDYVSFIDSGSAMHVDGVPRKNSCVAL